MAEKRGPNFEPVVDLLARLARDRVYGPLDMLSRVEDNDEFYENGEGGPLQRVEVRVD